jgi:hypothetical protein
LTRRRPVGVGADQDPTKPLIVFGGRYIDRMWRRDGRWASVTRVCPVEWQSDATFLLSPETIEFLDTTTSPWRQSERSFYRHFRCIGRPSAVPDFW